MHFMPLNVINQIRIPLAYQFWVLQWLNPKLTSAFEAPITLRLSQVCFIMRQAAGDPKYYLEAPLWLVNSGLVDGS